jgi:hypothetical protein
MKQFSLLTALLVPERAPFAARRVASTIRGNSDEPGASGTGHGLVGQLRAPGTGGPAARGVVWQGAAPAERARAAAQVITRRL